jgi:opacity protein-like surface antigen
MRKFMIRAVAIAALLGVAPPAFADATLFLGSLSSPDKRSVRGFAVGGGILVLGFEFEYAVSRDDVDKGIPELKTWMGNVLGQTPFGPIQLYATIGTGLYRETLGESQRSTNFGVNTGGGAKISLAGPLRLRIDYRVFKLRGEALFANPQRVYIGANLTF